MTSSFSAKLGALMLKKKVYELKDMLDVGNYGGAVLLGVKKPVIKAHGSADARTFKNAVKQAVWFLKNDLINEIEKSLRVEE